MTKLLIHRRTTKRSACVTYILVIHQSSISELKANKFPKRTTLNSVPFLRKGIIITCSIDASFTQVMLFAPKPNFRRLYAKELAANIHPGQVICWNKKMLKQVLSFGDEFDRQNTKLKTRTCSQRNFLNMNSKCLPPLPVSFLPTVRFWKLTVTTQD